MYRFGTESRCLSRFMISFEPKRRGASAFASKQNKKTYGSAFSFEGFGIYEISKIDFRLRAFFVDSVVFAVNPRGKRRMDARAVEKF